MRRRLSLSLCLVLGARAALAIQDPTPVRGRDAGVIRAFADGGSPGDSPHDTLPVNAAGATPPPFTGVSPSAATATIDRISTLTSYGSSTAGVPALEVPGRASTYFLSDGTSWPSGAGSYQHANVALTGVVVSSGLVRYYFAPPPGGLLSQQTDYSYGDHSAQGTLGGSDPLLLEAVIGSSTAVLRGVATILANDATSYPTFNYYSAPVGARVPFQVTYAITEPGGWTADIFDRTFPYTASGQISFVDPVVPAPLADLTIFGPATLTGVSTFRYSAIARDQGSLLRDVSGTASWSVEPPELAQVESGVCTTAPLSSSPVTLTLHASFVDGAAGVSGEKPVTYREAPPEPQPAPNEWPMFQANAWHTGHLARTLDPSVFRVQWHTDLGGGAQLNPVTGAGGRVFASLEIYFQTVPSLFAVEAAGGSVLWSKTYAGTLGGVFSVNPPSTAFGNVYVQTGDHGSDTWLHAYDAATGGVVFEAPHSAQWERYFAPTIFDGNVYVDGGYYGGAYAFDAITGQNLWFQGLPQYDQWTPAVDDEHVYAYLGEYRPGLYVLRRSTGEFEYLVDDPDFVWNGWSMNLAPVLGRHSDVVVVHDGRLVSFDTASRTIRWARKSAFTGQPSVARDAVYAIDGGSLVVLDEVTGAKLWSWQPSFGETLTGSMIVTDGHVLASGTGHVFAVDLETHEDVWSLPVTGQLALANGSLYVAGSNGVLVAIGVLPPGDANGDGRVDVQDVFFLLNSVFVGGAPPVGGACDVNADGRTDVVDIFFLINYVFAGGPAPLGVGRPG